MTKTEMKAKGAMENGVLLDRYYESLTFGELNDLLLPSEGHDLPVTIATLKALTNKYLQVSEADSAIRTDLAITFDRLLYFTTPNVNPLTTPVDNDSKYIQNVSIQTWAILNRKFNQNVATSNLPGLTQVVDKLNYAVAEAIEVLHRPEDPLMSAIMQKAGGSLRLSKRNKSKEAMEDAIPAS